MFKVAAAARLPVSGILLFAIAVWATTDTAVAAGTSSPAQAPIIAQRSFLASPDIYKIVADSPKYMVMEVTWKPGQRDKVHSDGPNAIYYLDDCNLRWYNANNTSMELAPKAGESYVQTPIGSLSVENIGKSDCKLVMFEVK